MNQLQGFDILLLLILLSTVFTACSRGLGKETLHTVLYVLAVVAGAFVLGTKSIPDDAAGVATMLLNMGYYIITVYVFTWAITRVGAPILIKSGEIGLRSRFWAGIMAMCTMVCSLLGLNLWLAIHSPDAHPQRLNALPDFMRTSTLVQISDSVTEDIYQWAASKDFLTYKKYTQRALTPEEETLRQGMESTGLQSPQNEVTPSGTVRENP